MLIHIEQKGKGLYCQSLSCKMLRSMVALVCHILITFYSITR